MCGIVGYVGSKSAISVLMVGLTKLEYRGYDSAGVAVLNGHGVELRRTVGKLEVLRKSLHDEPIDGHIGIAHTRWATHGEPNETNSHPHRDATETVFVAHNGIIENYGELRAELEAQGVVFRSQTDSEVVPNLVKRAYDECGDFPEAVRRALSQVHGSYAVAVLHKDYPGTLVAARQMSPLVLGLGNGENFFASDVPAILNATRRVIFLDDGEMAVLSPEKVVVYDLDTPIEAGKPRHKAAVTIDWSPEQAEKGGYTHYMLKEIHEQPDVINRLLSRYTNPERTHINLDQIGITDDELRGIRRIFIQACGTSWHAGLIGKYLLERLPMIAVDVDTSSEFRYRNAILSPDTLVIAISQSGETADTLAGIREANRRGLKVISIVNVPGSTIARESAGVIYINAGPEVGVASTKAYTAQIAALYLLSLHLGVIHGLVDTERLQRRLSKLGEVPGLMQRTLEDDSEVRRVAEEFAHADNAMFIGRGFGYPNALEGALKLKEISYIHAEGYPAGELKHGPIALIDEKMPVVAIATSGAVYEKMVSNIQEVRARKGRVIAITGQGNTHINAHADFIIRVPELTESFAPLLTALPLQLLAYHIANLRGCDVDQPRNLAKSVTVE
ncbi:MAG: glutamine--fructose-6-phosphate transaminase (isomerizing) [Abitibacteriaceae bacterium]|nr:glutamine--fructose-6-phosphate transaminase (isomerizing) [Abditibacteriaceae bacterium]